MYIKKLHVISMMSGIQIMLYSWYKLGVLVKPFIVVMVLYRCRCKCFISARGVPYI